MDKHINKIFCVLAIVVGVMYCSRCSTPPSQPSSDRLLNPDEDGFFQQAKE